MKEFILFSVTIMKAMNDKNICLCLFDQKEKYLAIYA